MGREVLRTGGADEEVQEERVTPKATPDAGKPHKKNYIRNETAGIFPSTPTSAGGTTRTGISYQRGGNGQGLPGRSDNNNNSGSEVRGEKQKGHRPRPLTSSPMDDGWRDVNKTMDIDDSTVENPEGDDFEHDDYATGTDEEGDLSLIHI